MSDAYALKEVKMSGETLQARPIAWDGEDYSGTGVSRDGLDIEAVKWETVCPGCAQLMHFSNRQIIDENTVLCPKCDAPKTIAEESQEEDDFIPSLVEQAPPAEYEKDTSRFADPILSGRFAYDIVDYELMEKIN